MACDVPVRHLGDALVTSVPSLEVHIRRPVVGEIIGRVAGCARRNLGDVGVGHGGVERVSTDDLVNMGRRHLSGVHKRVKTLDSDLRAAESQVVQPVHEPLGVGQSREEESRPDHDVDGVCNQRQPRSKVDNRDEEEQEKNQEMLPRAGISHMSPVASACSRPPWHTMAGGHMCNMPTISVVTLALDMDVALFASRQCPEIAPIRHWVLLWKRQYQVCGKRPIGSSSPGRSHGATCQYGSARIGRIPPRRGAMGYVVAMQTGNRLDASDTRMAG